MKKYLYFFSLALILSGTPLLTTSCSPKVGCPSMGTTATKKEKRKGGTSNLFTKKNRKKSKSSRF